MSWKANKEYIITNVRIYDYHIFIENGFIHFDSKIIRVAPMSEFNEYNDKIVRLLDTVVIDGTNQLVLPNFIAGHTHIYSTFSRGMSVPFDPKNFQDILDQLWWKLDDKLDLNTVYLSGITSGIDFAKSGVTTIIDHHASGEITNSLLNLSKGVCDRVGIRGGFCFETSDRYDVKQCIEENMNFINGNTNNETRFALFGLHASMSLSDETLKAVKKAVKDKPIHIHVAESAQDQEDCMKLYNKRIVQRLYEFGLLNEKSILAHCIHINEDEAKLIEENNCYIAMNVTSNMNNSVGLADYQMFKKHNIKCIIGNDGMTSDIASEFRNTLFAMHHQTKSPTGYSLGDLHEMILNSYEYINNMLPVNIGELKTNFESDLMIVDYTPYTPMNKENALGHLVFGLFHNFKPRHVWCKGNRLIKDYDLDNDRYETVLEELQNVQEITQKLWNKIN